MRKNGVNRELRPISKGLLAPDGFRLAVATVKDGAYESGAEKPLALLSFADRYPTACAFSTSAVRGDSALYLERNVKDGMANAVLFNGTFSDLLQKNAEFQINALTQTIAKACKMQSKDVLVLSTGDVRAPYRGEKISESFLSLATAAYNDTHVFSAEFLGVNQAAFEFDLGDFPCKIGACFKRLGASVFAYLTTDVNVTPACLEKAFSTVVKDTFDLVGEGQSAPRFFAGISSSCKAGNFVVSERDGEFKKFADALRSVCEKICRILVLGESQKGAECILTGTRSKTVSRALARALSRFLSCPYDKQDFLSGVLDAVGSTDVEFSLKKASLTVSDGGNRLSLLEDGEAIAAPSDRLNRVLSAPFFTLELNLSDGNYSSRTFAYAHTTKREEPNA